jgi:hypothetical protein
MVMSQESRCRSYLCEGITLAVALILLAQWPSSQMVFFTTT